MTMTTPQRLDLAAQNQQLQATLFQHFAAATRRFYGVLTPDQQRIFDQTTGPGRQSMGGPPPPR